MFYRMMYCDRGYCYAPLHGTPRSVCRLVPTQFRERLTAYASAQQSACLLCLTGYPVLHSQLVFPIGLTVGLFATVMRFMVTGPLKFMWDSSIYAYCKDFWWRDLIFVDNFYFDKPLALESDLDVCTGGRGLRVLLSP
ncbi:hypothetical protein E2C01_037311 [Portunus trituberculatus]|uniref:Uncharacterized protein n=1 Tax=Portunus trituberculatus TaxID=210409 RepID=A0A5B7FEM3_PORTR|nr:hypothetical protein [Portunus trituberculatus]